MALDTYIEAVEATESHCSVQTFPKQKYYINVIRSIPNSAPGSGQMKRNLRALGVFIYSLIPLLSQRTDSLKTMLSL